MRPLWEGHGVRRASYWVLIAAFLTLSIYAGEQAFGLQQTLDNNEEERAQRELQALLSLSERSTLERVTAWIWHHDEQQANDLRKHVETMETDLLAEDVATVVVPATGLAG